jgi:nitroreductase
MITSEDKTLKFAELVQQRKSVRSYDNKREVSDEIIRKCLNAARLAPSACNSQPWKFIIIRDKELVRQIVDKSMSGVYRMNRFAGEAPVLVVVLTEKSRYIARLGGTLRKVKYSLIDVGIACDHFTLQAAELGLGTCFIGWFNEKGLKKVLKLPRAKSVDVVLTLGYPGKDYTPVQKPRKSLKDISSFC